MIRLGLQTKNIIIWYLDICIFWKIFLCMFLCRFLVFLCKWYFICFNEKTFLSFLFIRTEKSTTGRQTEELIQATFSSSHLIGCLSSEWRERLQTGRQRNGQTAWLQTRRQTEELIQGLANRTTGKKTEDTVTGYILILSPYWLPIFRTEGTITDRKTEKRTDGGTDTGYFLIRSHDCSFIIWQRM